MFDDFDTTIQSDEFAWKYEEELNRYRHHWRTGILSRDELYLGQRRTLLDVLCTVLHLRHSHRRQHCLCVPAEICVKRTSCTDAG